MEEEHEVYGGDIPDELEADLQLEDGEAEPDDRHPPAELQGDTTITTDDVASKARV